MNTTKVTITIHSAPQDNSEEAIRTSYTGLYRKVSDKHVISYEEAFVTEGEEPMTSKNIIKFNENMVHISKKGDVTSQMHFEKGCRHEGSYRTPYGIFSTEINTQQLVMKETTDGIHISLNYTLHMNQSLVSENAMTITITKMEKK